MPQAARRGQSRQELQGKFGIFATKKDEVRPSTNARMTHLTDEEQAARKDILDHFEHIKARGSSRRKPSTNWSGRSPSRT